jgi:ubiquitin carboxyl-terminal hydrolase 36/42
VTPLSLHTSIRFRLGRQEDAHEYLRCVLDAMHETFLKHIKPKPPPELASTTFIHRIFGGKLRSEVGGRLCSPQHLWLLPYSRPAFVCKRAMLLWTTAAAGVVCQVVWGPITRLLANCCCPCAHPVLV